MAGMPPVVLGAPMGGRAPLADAIGVALGVEEAGEEAAKDSTSFDVTMPSMPLPDFIANKSIPFSAANFLAAGLANGRSPDE